MAALKAKEQLIKIRDAVNEKVEKEFADPSREDRMFYLALALAEATPKRSLVSILAEPYPTMVERVKKLAPTVTER